MRKRFLALLLMVSLFTCALTANFQAEAAADRYKVGYAIKDINPYVYSDALGFGVKDLGELATDSTDTVAVSVYNPNTQETTQERMIRVPLSGYGNSSSRLSDSIIDDNGDGYTGVGDGLHITCTTITDSQGTTLVIYTIDALSGYDSIVSSVSEELWAKLKIKPQNVFINGSHTHEGPDYHSLKLTINDTSSNRHRLRRAYYDYTVQQMVDAAVECYEARTEAKMTKGTIDVSEKTGYQLNFVRNYKIDEYRAVSGGGYSSTPSNSYVYGPNFAVWRPPVEAAAAKITVKHVSESDDKMHILRFTPTNGDASILLVNWRAHATMMSDAGDTVISADYIASFRYAMQKDGYRMAFLQGAAGNIVTTSRLGRESMNSDPSLTGYWGSDVPADTSRAVYYGSKKLLHAARLCLGAMSGELATGPIRSTRQTLDLQIQQDSPGLIAAAEHYQLTGSLKYTYPKDGKLYILNSSYHASQVLARAKADPDYYEDLTVNAFTLGRYVTFVTSPTELFDRYSDTATLDNTTDNDWDDLVNPSTYGTPFVMAYTNGEHNYTANRLSYSYNAGSQAYGVGGYEANSSRTAAGEGEKIIREYKRMITSLEAPLASGYCPQCNATVQWEPLYDFSLRKSTTLTDGHYRLCEDVSLSTYRNNKATIAGNVCFDLNGCTFETLGRAFVVNEGMVLSILDSSSEKTGKVVAYNCEGAVTGGVVVVKNGAVLNLRSGTLKMDTDPTKGRTPPEGQSSIVTKGGVIFSGGEVNIYGGCVDASNCVLAPTANGVSAPYGCGAAIYINKTNVSASSLNIYDGKIIAGQAEPNNGKGDCVYNHLSGSQITLAGNAQVDEIYFNETPKLTIDKTFSGSVAVRYPDAGVVQDKVIGVINSDKDLSEFSIVCHNKPDAGFYVDGTSLRMSFLEAGTVAMVEGSNGKRFCNDLNTAVSFYTDGLITLTKGSTGSEVKVTKNINLNLSGYDIGNKVTVSSGSTLYCVDDKTEDFTVKDGVYGKLTDVSVSDGGKVTAGLPGDEDNYIKIRENNAYSFHRVNLRIHTMSLRPELNPGLYYMCDFEGDEVVARNVEQFGVALGLTDDIAKATTLDGNFLYSTFSDFESGPKGNSNNPSTLLSGIFKETNLPLENSRNAKFLIYGRAYLLLTDGTCAFGSTVSRSFRQQVEAVDDRWIEISPEQKTAVIEMCRKYFDIIKNWDIPNILEGIRQSAT